MSVLLCICGAIMVMVTVVVMVVVMVEAVVIVVCVLYVCFHSMHPICPLFFVVSFRDAIYIPVQLLSGTYWTLCPSGALFTPFFFASHVVKFTVDLG